MRLTDASVRALKAPATGVAVYSDDVLTGFGVRVIVNGQWGFAASPLVTPEEIARITREAVAVAKANASAQATPIQLAPVKAYTDRWTSAYDKDPFAVSVDEKLELMHSATLTIKKNPKVFSAFGGMGVQSEDKYFASSEGSQVVVPHQQARLVVFAVTRAEDGMDLFRDQTFEAETVDGLPKQAELEAALLAR